MTNVCFVETIVLGHGNGNHGRYGDHALIDGNRFRFSKDDRQG
jgi:hypothetical protein